jgi:hypothetical protein
MEYRRNALSTLLVYHPEDEFGAEIYKAFDSLPIPDKYDDHNMETRIIDNSQIWGVQRRDSGYYKATYGHQLTPSELKANALFTERLLNDAEAAKGMVAKWFGFDGNTVEDATFNTSLIQERGQYNASDIDVAVALQTTRGLAALSDAGEWTSEMTDPKVEDAYSNHQLRSRLKLEMDKKRNPWHPFVSGEMFNNMSDGMDIYKIRASAGFGYDFNKHHSLSFAYIITFFHREIENDYGERLHATSVSYDIKF